MADGGRSDCQGACVPMGKRTAQPSAAAASDNAARVQLGPYWLEYRAERDDWSICWYDPEARTRRRRKTGVGGSGRDRKHAVSGKSVSVRVNLGGRRHIKKKTQTKQHKTY